MLFCDDVFLIESQKPCNKLSLFFLKYLDFKLSKGVEMSLNHFKIKILKGKTIQRLDQSRISIIQERKFLRANLGLAIGVPPNMGQWPRLKRNKKK